MMAMTDRYLEVTYRKGKPFAAYFVLPRRPGDRSARTERFTESLIIDFAPDDRPIGIEIVHPQGVTDDEVNRALAHLNQPPLRHEDLAPLKAA